MRLMHSSKVLGRFWAVFGGGVFSGGVLLKQSLEIQEYSTEALGSLFHAVSSQAHKRNVSFFSCLKSRV